MGFKLKELITEATVRAFKDMYSLPYYGRFKQHSATDICSLKLDYQNYISGLSENRPNTVSFHKVRQHESEEEAIARLATATATLIIVPESIESKIHPNLGQIYLLAEDPMGLMCHLLNECSEYTTPEFVYRPAEQFEAKYIAHDVKIELGAKIGKGAIIESGCYIGSNVTIGDNAFIQAGSILGGEGFQNSIFQGRRIPWRHMSTLIIGNNVSIGNCCCIDRGLFTPTVFGNNVHLDNLIHVAHSCILENNVAIVASTMIAGSVTIKENTWVATSIVKNGVTIGKDSLVGLGAVVIRNVQDNKTVYGIPAKEH